MIGLELRVPFDEQRQVAAEIDCRSTGKIKTENVNRRCQKIEVMPEEIHTFLHTSTEKAPQTPLCETPRDENS